MNLTKIVLLSIVVFCFNSCQSDDIFTTPRDLVQLYYSNDKPICTATKEVPGLGSIAWKANCIVVDDSSSFRLIIGTRSDSIEMALRELITISEIPKIIGEAFKVSNSDINAATGGYSIFASDGDLLNASWIPNENPWFHSYVKITALDTLNKTIQGEFDLYFKMIRQGSFGLVHSEYINFKNGVFNTHYIE
ncbi:MAG: hypothetical protein KA974_08260 [Saprospiraceae bacterium]|nr:hypothetical protein [Saprospiraceae bacterium]MBP7699738.1 hypothetical protein [Saprospiraceae bacterium]